MVCLAGDLVSTSAGDLMIYPVDDLMIQLIHIVDD